MLEMLRQLYAYNWDVRTMLFTSVKGLTEGDYRRNLKAGHPALSSTLWHMASAEDHWFGKVLTDAGELLPEVERVPLPADLENMWQHVTERTRRFLGDLTEADLGRRLSVTWSDGTFEFDLGKALLHVATHEIHHRGQAVMMIRQLGHEPPYVDLI